MTEDGFSIEIDAGLDNLNRVRRFVAESAAELGTDSATVSDLRLAVDEAITNIIVHGYRDKTGKVRIEICRNGDALQVRIRDDAVLFDPLQTPMPDLAQPLAERDPGGMGVFLIRQVTDDARYAVTPSNENELILTKRAAARD